MPQTVRGKNNRKIKNKKRKETAATAQVRLWVACASDPNVILVQYLMQYLPCLRVAL